MKEIYDKLEALVSRIELLRLDAYLTYVRNWKQRLLMDFLSGIARGVGFSVGFTLLGALILYLLRNAAMSNLPIIGQFLADWVQIVETNP